MSKAFHSLYENEIISCAVNQMLKSVVREIRMLRSVGVGAPSWWPLLPGGCRVTGIPTTTKQTKDSLMSPDVFKIEISASAVAWYAAIVATAGMLVSLYSVFRDRAKIKIKYQRDMQIIGPQTVYDPNKTYFNITVTNQGRRPVNITKAAFRTIGTRKKYALLADSFSAHRNRVLDVKGSNLLIALL